ncbi:MAG: four helix bundle protein [Ignavibacteria bacterium]|jgi:four helix bundle protein|nr:four helix bundle protein [Ignavibacteria bacterium]
MELLTENSYKFAVRMIKLSQYLQEKKNEYILSQQILRSATIVGAHINRCKYTSDAAERFAELKSAITESYCVEYWLNLLVSTDYLNKAQFDIVSRECSDLRAYISDNINKFKEK